MLENLDIVLGVVAAGEQELEVDLCGLAVLVLAERDSVVATLQHPESHVTENREHHLGRDVLEHMTDIESEFLAGPFRRGETVTRHVVIER